jgi:penicillin-insensitive murein endopeptidase
MPTFFVKMARTCMMGSILMCGLGTLSSASASAATSPWEDVRTPAAGTPTIYGNPNAGCLLGGMPLEDHGVGFQIVAPNREFAHFGHPAGLNFIRELGRDYAEHNFAALIGDVSMPRGGPFTFQHASHQLGIEFDVWFLVDPRLMDGPLTVEQRRSLHSYYVADSDANVLLVNKFKPEHEAMIRMAAQKPEVHSIFVHPTIKKRFCADKANHQPWLAKLRPWWGHDEHMHVRLKCPTGQTACEDKAPPPGIACDSSLDWWFSDEWRKEYEARKLDGFVEPDSFVPLAELPKICASILSRK